MKLALIGYPINHSLSPKLYEELLGSKLTSYDLLPCKSSDQIPSLSNLRIRFDGINITSPYKTHFVPKIVITSPLVQKIGAVNTLSFASNEVLGTNTDVIAVEKILKSYKKENSSLHIILLGGGVMATVTMLVAQDLNIPLTQLRRSPDLDLSTLDLRSYRKSSCPNLIINACSRDFSFFGKVDSSDLFWDYNYDFIPHQKRIPELLKSYQDGREMLRLQAEAAIDFWRETNPKLKC